MICALIFNLHPSSMAPTLVQMSIDQTLVQIGRGPLATYKNKPIQKTWDLTQMACQSVVFLRMA